MIPHEKEHSISICTHLCRDWFGHHFRGYFVWDGVSPYLFSYRRSLGPCFYFCKRHIAVHQLVMGSPSRTQSKAISLGDHHCGFWIAHHSPGSGPNHVDDTTQPSPPTAHTCRPAGRPFRLDYSSPAWMRRFRSSTFSSIRAITARNSLSSLPLGSSSPQSSRWEQGKVGHWT